METDTNEKGAWINKDNQLLLACWEFEGVKKRCWGSELEQSELLEDIAKADFIVAHSTKFELGWLARCGLDLRTVQVFDTYLAEWVIGGNRWAQQALGLDECLQRHGLQGKHEVGKLIRLGVDTRNIPKPWLEEYCEQDTQDCKALFYKQLEILERDNLLHLLYARCLLVPVLTDMEAQGLTLDKERVDEAYRDTITKYNERLARLTEITGGINFKSKPQLSAFLYDTLGFDELKGRDKKPLRTPPSKKFPDGQRKTDAATIAQLKATSKGQREFLELIRELAKLNAALTKSLNFFKGVCDNYDGTFYGILNQGTTATHRLSSSGRPILIPDASGKKPKKVGAQLQNIAREFKRFFKAREPDWVIVEADGSGLEFRTAMEMFQDPVGIADILNGEDVHSITRDVLLAAGAPYITPDSAGRQRSKPVTFSPVYGGQGKDEYEKEYVRFFRDKYVCLYEGQTEWTRKVLRDKYLITPYGIRFYWPDTVLTRSGYITNSTNIFNYGVQGFATAEIIPIALIWLWYRSAHLRLKIVLTVHDSVILEVHPDDVEALKPILAECFTVRVYETLESLYNYEFKNVPLAAGIKAGKFWGEGVETTATVHPSTRGTVTWKTK